MSFCSGCVDIYNSKVLRAGGGAHFQIPILSDVSWPYIGNYIPDDSRLTLVCNESPRKGVRAQTEALRSVLHEQQDRENTVEFEQDESGDYIQCDDSFADASVRKYETIALPTLPLFDFNVGDATHVTCVVSGSSRGASMFAKKLLFERGGDEVFVERGVGDAPPLPVNTLGSLLLFETHTQLRRKGLVKGFEEQGALRP